MRRRVVSAAVGVGAGALASFALATLGLAIDERFMLLVGFPIGLLVATSVSIVVAGVVSNVVARGDPRADLPRGLARGVAWSAGGSLALVLALLARPWLGAAPLGFVLLPVSAVIAGAAAYQAVGMRRASPTRGRDRWVVAGVLLSIPAAFFGMLWLSCAMDMCGA